MREAGPIRVLVVDDSALMRQLLPKLLTTDPAIEVVGTAVDGDFALRKVEALHPDVVTLDLDMPRMDGFTVLKRLLRDHRIPVLIVSSLSRHGAEATLRALELGAVDVVAKPEGVVSRRLGEIAAELTAKVRAAAALPPHHPLFTRVVPGEVSDVSPSEWTTEAPVKAPAPAQGEVGPAAPEPARGAHATAAWDEPAADRLVVIGVSTGGPYALTELLPRLPADFPAAVAVVQHMPPGFTEPLATRLNSLSAITVREAADGMRLVPGLALVAPGDRHLRLRRAGRGAEAALSDEPPVNGHRPSADVLFESAAAVFGARGVGLVMTGMGSDGAEGLARIRLAGGRTLAQDAASCVVNGMPRAAVARGVVERIVALADLPAVLVRLVTDPPGSFDREEDRPC
jgi:two-component system chemotaxis response regulator CheB